MNSGIVVRMVQRSLRTHDCQTEGAYMLRVIVELVPGGDESRKRELARADIGNISHLAPVSDYVVRASENMNGLAGRPAWAKTGLVTKHNRNQTVWALVARAADWAAHEATTIPTEKKR
jgi:hypothetical protein